MAQSKYAAELCGQPECDCCRYADWRIAVLEDRIRYALDSIRSGFVSEASFELDRALNDPDLQKPDSR